MLNGHIGKPDKVKESFNRSYTRIENKTSRLTHTEAKGTVTIGRCRGDEGKGVGQ